MIKKLVLSLVLIVMLQMQPVIAHPGGHAPMDEQQAIRVAAMVVAQLVDTDAGLGFGKLKQNWTALPNEATQIHQRGPGYYIVRVVNAAEQRTLYVLMSVQGQIFDANFTGTFKGL